MATTTEKERKKNKQSKANLVKKKAFSSSPSQELKKVTWPNRNTLVKSTSLILVIIVISTVYVSGIDIIFENLFSILNNIVK